MEHSLEVQLPFLQKTLGSFKLLPFAVGTATIAEVRRSSSGSGRPGDADRHLHRLSHYHDYARPAASTARPLKIAAFATDLNHEEACGATPLKRTAACFEKTIFPEAPAACNSGDTAGGATAWFAIRRSSLRGRRAVARRGGQGR